MSFVSPKFFIKSQGSQMSPIDLNDLGSEGKDSVISNK